MLAYLLAHRDRVFATQELLEQLWPAQFVGDEALKACIKTLRQALGDRRRPPRFVRTLHGQGYCFVAPVAVQEHVLGDAAPSALTPPPSLPPHPAGEQALHEAPAPLARVLAGEHKQVTVLCGALAEGLGPEAMYRLMHDVLTLAQDTVQRYGGTLLQALGAGFVALFGAPVAHEDHARRAVVAVLELRQRLRTPDALRGQGQVLGIAGEPGMGKSRLLAEFAHSLTGQAVTYCEGHCLAYGSTIPYLPVRDLLRQLWDLPDTTIPEALTATIEQRLHAAGIGTADGVPLLLQLLDMPKEAEGLAAMSPEARRARTFTLLRQLVLHASQSQPLVLAVENLHWSDPTSEEWLAAVAAGLGARLSQLPLSL